MPEKQRYIEQQAGLSTNGAECKIHFDGRQDAREIQGLTRPSLEARGLLDQYIRTPEIVPLGPITTITDIKSSVGPFSVLPEYRAQYSPVVTEALGNIYAEYNEAFRPLVAANREWSTDYQYCMASDGTPVNGWVQIDMVGLPEGFLKAAPSLREGEVREALKGRIYEIENSLAMYQLLENLFRDGQRDTLFNRQFRASLDDVRRMYGMPIALLAVTDQKHQAMRQSEFGKVDGEPLTDEEVKELSGFDRFFGPEEFQDYLAENRGECGYLLYARTSDPVSKLKKPDTKVEVPLLEDDNTRRIIKANALTFNVDSPAWTNGHHRRINDTKEYLPLMGMAHAAYSDTDILSSDFAAHLLAGKGYSDYHDTERLSPAFTSYLRSKGIDPITVESGQTALRAKPMKGAYGCYGHISGVLEDKQFRKEFRQNLLRRGPYVVQPEMPRTTLVNATDGRAYTYIDRVFFSTDSQNYRFLGGFRSCMPLDTVEAASGRNHGSKYTVWAEIA